MTQPRWIVNDAGEHALTQLLQACDPTLFRSAAPMPVMRDLAVPTVAVVPSPSAATSAYSPATLPPVEWPSQQPEFRAPQTASPLRQSGVSVPLGSEAVPVDPLGPYGHRRF